MPFNPVLNSTFLDAFGAILYNAQQYQQLAAGNTAPFVELFHDGTKPTTIEAADGGTRVNVGLMLDRAADPASLLSGNWAQRQAGLAAFATPDALWATYGADAGSYATTLGQINGVLGGSGPADTASAIGYVSSAADRTIWVRLDPRQFQDLFGQELLQVTSGSNSTLAWAGNLQLNDQITAGVIKGLWVEKSVTIANPAVLFSAQVSPPPGPLGIANSTELGVGDGPGTPSVAATPAAIAAHYNFPLPAGVATDPVALIEGNVPTQAALFDAYNQYRQKVGLPTLTSQQFQIVSGTNGSGPSSSELTLDISVVAGAVPNSSVLMYSFLDGTPFNAYQQAFFNSTNRPAVLSSSFGASGLSTAQSPFAWAFQQLMLDGVLANVSVHRSAGDSGSGGDVPNGAANLSNDHSSQFMLLVGGTSIASLSSALSDPTVQSLLTLALNGDPGTIFPLVSAGLKTLPSHLSAAAPAPLGAAATLTALFEAVWQALDVKQREWDHQSVLEVSYGAHETGGGAIATQTAIPGYQSTFGLASLTGGGRGMPDVSALSSGDAHYAVLNADHVGHPNQPLLTGNGGTSAASPLWASLTTQFNSIFHDQGLPSLGFYNDLLYIAAAIAPGSFNDIQLGNNITSFYVSTEKTGYINPGFGNDYIVPTGHGYAATPGYDLTTGLGTPNGTLLARALTAIAHSQVSFASSPALLDDDGLGGWLSGADQGLLFQATSPGSGSSINVSLGDDVLAFASGASASFAWSSQLAQQSLQADFDPGLVLLFDKQAQGATSFARIVANEGLAVTIDGTAAQAIQASLSNPFGFATFSSANDALSVARPLAIAETVGAQDNQLAVVRLRQGGSDSLQLTFYRVDDLTGTIDGREPGHAAYAAAVQGRAYQTVSGATSITGPGYGQYAQTMLQDVDAGDIIAMRLDNVTTGAFFWAFANANEKVGGQAVGHLWNYGLNTWGWEDTFGGGDRDFNDLVVQLDFTSASGRGWLV